MKKAIKKNQVVEEVLTESQNSELTGVETQTPDFLDIQDLPDPEEQKEQNKILDLENKMSEILKRLEDITEENARLKESKFKMSFEQAQELYNKKVRLLDQLKKFETHKKEISESLKLIEEEALFESGKFSISFGGSSGYRDEPKFKISNTHILNEFLVFVSEKIEIKIEQLKSQVETIEL